MISYSTDNTLLLLPGPVAIHPRVYAAMNVPIYGHRTDHFRKIYAECVEMIKPVFGTTSADAYLLTGSGSLGLEAGIINFISPNDTVISMSAGKFGERSAKIARVFAKEVIEIKSPYGDPSLPEQLEKAFEETSATLVTVTHNETSTAVLNPLEDIVRVAHKHGAMVMADTITSAGGDWVKMDDWGVDIAVSGSQKCFGLPPGLGFVLASQKAVNHMLSIEQRVPSFYADLVMFKNAVEKGSGTPFTPAISLFYGLHESLKIIEEEGLENRIKRHHQMGYIIREAMKAMELELFAKEGYYSNTVTAVKIPQGINWGDLNKTIQKLGLIVAGGQGSMKGKIFRVGHMNIVGDREALLAVTGIETALNKLGHETHGRGVQKAQQLVAELL